MDDTQSQTESLLEIVKGIQSNTIMLPEFQRDFRWELEQTYDLFDSLVKDIFIGTIIYGKPSFEMTLREIDKRPRKGKGSNAKLTNIYYTKEEIIKKAQTGGFRIVLDGQQRITSIYRAIVPDLDSVYLIAREKLLDLDITEINQLSLEEMVNCFTGDQSKDFISVKLSHAYEAEVNSLDDEELNDLFNASAFMQQIFLSEDERKKAQRIYRRIIRKLIDLYKQQKMVAYYLLDMDLEKFCTFFERSNSRGIQLNFTDILAAKLYKDFNLRSKIDEFKDKNSKDIELNREVIIRTIAYIVAEGKGPISIDKRFILLNLTAKDFLTYWDDVCNMYIEVFRYLTNQHYILSQNWMPSENMVIPLMIFLREVKSFDRISEDQRKFLEYWYWASVFSNRYSSSSNEIIISDCNVLKQVAQNKPIITRGYFSRMRPIISQPDDLFNYTKKTSAVYRGVLSILEYAAKGLMDWNSNQKLYVTKGLEDHHIYPRAYIASRPKMEDIDKNEAEQLVDCVVNRTLISKPLNAAIGKNPPSAYLSKIKESSNPQLPECLQSHLIPVELITDSVLDLRFKDFLDKRAQRIFYLIEKHTIAQVSEVQTRHWQSDT
jgi:hypothetical protein